MANVFDQFDQSQAPPPKESGNVFDQFDSPPQQQGGSGLGHGLMKGVSGVVGGVSDLMSAAGKGAGYAITKPAEWAGVLTPEQGADIRGELPGEQSPMGSENINKNLLGAAGALGANTNPPQTGLGKATENVASFIPQAVALGPAGGAGTVARSALKYGLVPGLTSEAAGQATEGTAAEPYARMAGAVLGSGASIASNVIGARKEAAEIRSLLPEGGLSQTEATAANNLRTGSQNAGAPLSNAEAIDATTGGRSNLTAMQNKLGQQNNGAGAQTRQFFANRPQQTQELSGNMMSAIGPDVQNPHAVTPAIQRAGQQAVQDAQGYRTAATRPLYEAAAQDQVPVSRMNDFIGKIDSAIGSDRTGLISPSLQRFRSSLMDTATGAPLTDIDNLNTARKVFRDQIAAPEISQDALPKTVGAKLGPLVGELGDILDDSSPAYTKANQEFQRLSTSEVQPVLESPLGQLAKAQGLEKQASILLNKNPLPGSELGVSQAIRQIATQDPGLAQQFVRMHLERALNGAADGPAFAKTIANPANPQQTKNLQAMMEALPDGSDRWKAFSNGLKILQAQGYKQVDGSGLATAVNAEMKKGSVAGRILGAAGLTAAEHGLGAWRFADIANDMYKDFRYGRNTSRLAQLLTEGSAGQVRAIANAPSKKMIGPAILAASLAGRSGAMATTTPDTSDIYQ